MTPIRIAAGGIGFNFLPVYVADRGHLFSKNGLEVKTTLLPSVDKATAAVKDGALDIAITPPEGAIRDAVAAGNLRIIAANVNRLPLSLIAHPRFERIEDLKGAVLGTSSLTEGTALYTMEVLRRHGLNYPSDYSFNVVGLHPARWKALQEGTIDAAVQLIPLNFIAEDAGFRNLGEVTDYILEIAFTAIIVDRKWAEVNRASVVAFLRSVFNQFGDLERCALRSGNVHSADDWHDVLEPVVARYALAYNLANFLRTLALPGEIEKWSLTSLREKLVKIGAKLVAHERYTTFQMAEVAVPRDLFRRILEMIDGLRQKAPARC